MMRTALVVVLLAGSRVGFAQSVTVSQDSIFPVLTGPYFGQDPPGDVPVLFAPGILSTGKEHSAAMFTPGGNEMWFGRIFPAALWFSRLEDGRWTRPVQAPFGDEWGELYPVLAPTGNQVFYTTRRPVDETRGPLHRGRGYIWMVDRSGVGWSAPQYLGDRVNFSSRHSCGSIAADGTMYFVARDDKSSMELYSADLVDGDYLAPRVLTELISTAPEHCPYAAPDESYIIYSSFKGGFGRSDLFVSFRQADGSWSEPSNMGARINSPWKDEYPFVSPDGKYLFFNSNRPSELNDKPIPDGPGNIYWVKARIIDDVRSGVGK